MEEGASQGGFEEEKNCEEEKCLWVMMGIKGGFKLLEREGYQRRINSL